MGKTVFSSKKFCFAQNLFKAFLTWKEYLVHYNQLDAGANSAEIQGGGASQSNKPRLASWVTRLVRNEGGTTHKKSVYFRGQTIKQSLTILSRNRARTTDKHSYSYVLSKYIYSYYDISHMTRPPSRQSWRWPERVN